jgi:hypothetical protein
VDVQRAEGFVHEENVGLDDPRLSQGNRLRMPPLSTLEKINSHIFLGLNICDDF